MNGEYLSLEDAKKIRRYNILLKRLKTYKKENERLNNILNELEEHLIEVDKKYNKCSCYNDILQELYKLKNYKYLKDSDK